MKYAVLKSGGPTMRIVSIEVRLDVIKNGLAVCEWKEGKTVKRDKFPLACLIATTKQRACVK